MPKTLPARRPRIDAIVLAAGGSTRLGRPKQLLRRGTEPLLVRATRLAREAGCAEVVVVLGAGATRLRSVLRRHQARARVVQNPDWSEGMGTSLGAGLRGLSPRAGGALILLTDQAALTAADLERLTAHWRRAPRQAAAARYGGRIGVPAVIPRRWFRAIGKLEGDAGARHLLRRVGSVRAVDMPRAAFDVDTENDAAALAARRFTRSRPATARRPTPGLRN